MYADMSMSTAVKMYYDKSGCREDPVTIHRSPEDVLACIAFNTRITDEQHTLKLADNWAIENVCAILKDRVKAAKPKTKGELAKLMMSRTWTRTKRCAGTRSPPSQTRYKLSLT